MDYPPFADAIARFRSFLDDQGRRGPIRWVFPDDVLLVGGRWIIRPRPQAQVVEEVAAVYQRAAAGRLGVKFGVLCRDGEVLWCYVYYPVDRIEAECGLMPDGLKLSVADNPYQGRVMTDEGEWKSLLAHEQVEFKRWLFM